MGLWTFDPKELHVTLGTMRLEGWADGSFVTITYNADMFSLTMGADGFGARSKSNDNSAKVNFRLMPAAPVNIALGAMAIADRLTNKGVLPLVIKLLSTTPPTVYASPGAWVVKDPGQAFSKASIDPLDWNIETHELLPVHGGENLLVPILGI